MRRFSALTTSAALTSSSSSAVAAALVATTAPFNGCTTIGGMVMTRRTAASVGAPTTPTAATEAVASAFEGRPNVTEFGSVKRREQRRQERLIRNKASMDALAHMERLISRPKPSEELEAQSQLRDLGFLFKPPSCVYFRQFQAELRRYRIDIVMHSASDSVQLFSMTDFGLDGKGESDVKLCEDLRSYSKEGGDENFLSDLHEGITTMLYSTKPTTHDIRIANEFGIAYTLRFESVMPLGDGNAHLQSVLSDVNATAEERAAAEHEFILNESLRGAFEPVPGGPYRRYLQRVNASLINNQSGQRKELFMNVSIQAFTYLFIMAISRFLKAAKSTKRLPFDVDSINYLRFSIVNLRQQIGMEAIGEFELDNFLPK